MTQEALSGYRRFEGLCEASYWLLAVGLAIFAQATLHPGDARLPWLFAICAAFAVTAIVYFRTMPIERFEGTVSWRAEDKALLVSLTAVLLLTTFVRLVGTQASDIMYVYFVPILLATLLYEERLVLAEAALAIVALSFLEASNSETGIFNVASAARLMVFVVVAVTALFLTAELRARNNRSEQLLKELSLRLDQIQVVSVIVRQIEFFSRLDTLIQRVTEILASAFSASRAGVMLTDTGSGQLVPRGIYGPTLSYEELAACRRAYDTGAFVTSDGLIAVPLRLRGDHIGAMYVAGRPTSLGQAATFAKAETDFFELLGNYIAILVGNAMSFQALSNERQQAEHMAQLMVGRELKMRELKSKLREEGKGV